MPTAGNSVLTHLSTRTQMQNLLSVAFNQTNDSSNSLQRTICIIGLDLSRPWTFPRALERWSKVIEEVVGARLQHLKPNERTALASKQAAYLARCYGVTREEDSTGSSFNLKTLDSAAAAAEGNREGTVGVNEGLQLPKGVLENNLGLPIIVVGLKADLVQVYIYMCVACLE